MIKRPPVHQDPTPEALRTTSIRCPQSCQPRARCLCWMKVKLRVSAHDGGPPSIATLIFVVSNPVLPI